MTSGKDYSSNAPIVEQPEFCTSEFGYEIIEGQNMLVELGRVCGREIKTMAFKGTGVCGEEHRKAVAAVVGGADVYQDQIVPVWQNAPF